MKSIEKDVLIVGGGLAGLTAAHALKESGFSVLVLESDSRLGGRVKTIEIDGLAVEMGGEFIGDDHTKIQALCKKFELELSDHKYRKPCFRINPHLIIDEDLPTNYWIQRTDLRKTVIDLLANKTSQERLKSISWKDLLSDLKLPEDFLYIENILARISYGYDISRLPAINMATDMISKVHENEDSYWIKGGNKRLVDCLENTLDPEDFRLNTKAEVIKQSNLIEIQTNTGESFTSDKVVIALPPFAILDLEWIPAMPTAKIDALANIRYARITKIANEFPTRFWTDDGFSMLQSGNPDAIYHSSQGQEGVTGILTAYAVGKNASEMVRADECIKKRMITHPLVQKFGRIPHIVWSSTTHWDKAYSAYINSSFDETSALVRQSWLNAYFAGEHIPTEFSKQGYMEGAVSSGLQVASEIMNRRVCA